LHPEYVHVAPLQPVPTLLVVSQAIPQPVQFDTPSSRVSQPFVFGALESQSA
jgi:hypothetical protein